MESLGTILDKVINALCWETTAGLHIQRTMKVYGHHFHQIKILEEHCEKEMIGEIVAIGPIYITHTKQTIIERGLVGV